jgi:hypothetical protein
MKKVAYVAGDHGPRETLAALAAHLPGAAALAQDTELLVCGTSDSPQGCGLEAGARKAASARAIPAVVIEDFAGNYRGVAGGAPRLLLVESAFAAELARAREPALRVEVVPCLRYDPLRRRLSELRSRSRAREEAVLWIGQPETADSLETLRRLLAPLAALQCRVWLRAHPRDEGYSRGAYADLGLEDVTSRPLEECLARRPRLVITQFSSVAIEAGFWGIPALNVLFADVGGRTLAAKKGYSVPPWCEAGAAFAILQPRDVDRVLDRALGSTEARRRVIEAFDHYFQVHAEGAPKVINLLYNQGLL